MTRYRMSETMRQYAQERLDESGETEVMRRRHGLFFLALAEKEQASRAPAPQADWLKSVEAEYDNLRLALQWSREQSAQPEIEFRLTVALYSFWYLRGYLREGRAYMERAAERAGALRAVRWEAYLLLRVGGLASIEGDVTAAETALRQSLARAAEGSYVQVAALLLLGTLALDRRDYDAATPLLERARTAAAQHGYRGLEIESLVWPGSAARWRGDDAAAAGFFAQAEALTTAGDWHWANIQGLKADLALAQGDTAGAFALACQALRGYEQCGDRTFAVRLLSLFAEIALRYREAATAAQLLAFIESYTRARQVPLPPQDREHLDRLTRETRAALSATTYAEAQSAGHKMEWEQALSLSQSVGENRAR